MTYVQILNRIVNRAKCHILTTGELNGPFIIVMPRNPDKPATRSMAMDLVTLLDSLTNAAIIRLADTMAEESSAPVNVWADFLQELRSDAYKVIEHKLRKHGPTVIVKPIGTPGKPAQPMTFTHKLFADTRIPVMTAAMFAGIAMVTGQVRTTTYSGKLDITVPVTDLAVEPLCELADYLETI